MSKPLEQLTDPAFVEDAQSLTLEEVRARRGACQDAEEALSLQRRLVQGRLDIVQAELYRRAGGGTEADVSKLVESLPDILIEHGDRHLGPGRLTSLEKETKLGDDFDELVRRLDEIVDGARLSNLSSADDESVREIANQLDELEKGISKNRHQLHKHIDVLQEEVVRRYKTGEASVDKLLGS